VIYWNLLFKKYGKIPTRILALNSRSVAPLDTLRRLLLQSTRAAVVDPFEYRRSRNAKRRLSPEYISWKGVIMHHHYLRNALLPAAMILGLGVGSAIAAQPHMQAALAALQTARAQLQAATPDKGGHRVAAIADIDQAIGEVRAGMAVGANQ
jgi:hypothetical protein